MNQTVRDIAPEMTNTATVDAASLREAIRFAGQLTRRSPRIPVLGTLLFRFTPGELTLIGTDLDCDCQTRIDAIANEDFAFCLTPTTLMAVLHGARGPVSIGLGADRLCRVATTEVTADFRSIIPAEDFPLIPEGRLQSEDGVVHQVEVPEGVLAKVLADTLPCVSTEETRYYLNGVYLHAVDGMLAGIATDGHRLSLRRTKVPFEGFDGILPAVIARTLARQLRADGNRAIRISGTATHRRVTAEGEAWQITHKMIDGTFPDYRRVLPTKPATISVPLSLEQVRRAARVARTGGGRFGSERCLKLSPATGRMSIKLSGAETEVSFPMPGGTGAEFGLNVRSLVDLLSRNPIARLESAGVNDPFMVVGEDLTLTQVIMPIRV